MKDPWYKEGLRFKCTGCGECCTGAPGYVLIDEAEIEEISKALNIDRASFLKHYTRQIEGKVALIERAINNTRYDCIFLKERKCLIYAHRPKQCRTFPWWKENLASLEAWKEAAAHCEGINHKEAPLIPLGDIEAALK